MTGPEAMGTITQVALLDADQVTEVEEVLDTWNDPVPLAAPKPLEVGEMENPADPAPDCVTV